MLFYLSLVTSTIVCEKCGNYQGNSNCCHEGGSWVNMCGDVSEKRYSWQYGYLVCNLPDTKLSSMMVIVPGHDGTNRKSQRLHKSLQNLMKSSISTNSMNLLLECSIYFYDEVMYKKHVSSKSSLYELCDMQLSFGKWTSHMLKYRGSHDYVAVLMDDVYINVDFNIQSFVSVMLGNSFDMASASLKHSWHWTLMQKVNNCMFRKTHYSDILFSVFRGDSFRCWLNEINLLSNSYGWGLDITFPYKCHASVGIIDTQSVVHNAGSDPAKGGTRTYDEATALRQLWNHLNDSKVPELISLVRNVSNPMDNLISYINGESGYACEQMPLYHIIDPSYFQTASHGWHTIMENLIQHNIASTYGGHIKLIDCCESFFLWQKRTINRPWIGVIHFTPNLPNTFPVEETLQGLIQSQNFKSALYKCKLLIVLSTATADWLRVQLNIPIKVIYHPMSTDVKCVPYVKTETQLKFLILLGNQYRRVSTIYLLKATHNMTKVWLPGTKDSEKLKRLFHRESETRLMNFEDVSTLHVPANEYDKTLSDNVIIIDLWDAAANNAILEVIALNIPAYIRRLPATEEYLGKKYPLFFDDLSDLQKMINMPLKIIIAQRINAKKYLCSTFRHSKDYTLSSFITSMKSIALSLSLFKHGLKGKL